jgi:tetratricopeptide (TPR) repeat protein
MRLHSLAPFLLAPAIALIQSAPAAALPAAQVRQIAEERTVLIDGVNLGSGVIIDRMGDNYAVLTAQHVVGTADGYTIVTSTGDRYPINYSQVIKLRGVDLAIVRFTSSRNYPVATLANYAYNAEFRTVYTAGWTAARSRQFTAGMLGDRNFSLALTQGLRQDGYELFYTNLTQIGMSGGGVWDADGRVIGIHGLAEGEEINNGQLGIARVKRGFSSGIPISTFLRQLSQVGLALSSQIETTPPIAVAPPLFYNSAPSSASSAIEWTNQANELYRSGQLQSALNALHQALKIDPKFHLAWYERGNVLFAMKRYMEALESYDYTINLNPNLYSVWRDRGVLLALLNKYVAALGCFDRATELKPDDYVLWYMRGNLLNKNLRSYQYAIASYDRALAINPNFADAWMGKGNALHEQRQYQTALDAYNQALQLNPELNITWILQARTLVELGRRSEAIVSLQRALQLNPNDSETQRFLASLQ